MKLVDTETGELVHVAPSAPASITVTGEAAVVAWCEATALWLDSTNTLSESAELLARVTVVEAAVRTQKLAEEAQQAAAELRFRAMRRVGEMIDAERAAGTLAKKGRPKRHLQPVNVDDDDIYENEPSTLPDHGITRDQAADYAKLAAPDPEVFDAAIKDAKKNGGLTGANVKRKLNPEGEKRPEERWLEADRWIARAANLAKDVDQFVLAVRFKFYPGEMPLVGQAASRHLADLKSAITRAQTELNR